MYKRKALKRELYDYLCREKIADQALISKWRKPGYENLCSLLSIQKSATNFGRRASVAFHGFQSSSTALDAERQDRMHFMLLGRRHHGRSNLVEHPDHGRHREKVEQKAQG